MFGTCKRREVEPKHNYFAAPTVNSDFSLTLTYQFQWASGYHCFLHWVKL